MTDTNIKSPVEMGREAEPTEVIEKAPFIYRHLFMAMEHNYLCAVCREKSAVIQTYNGLLQPCWDCQKTYRLVKINWLDKLLRRFEK